MTGPMTISITLGRDEDPQRATGGDGARGEPGAVAALHHDRRRHDPQHGDGRAHDAGGHGEDRGGEDHAEVERAAHRGQHDLERPEQPLHEAGLLDDIAHEDEQRHGGQGLLLHQADRLEEGEVEDDGAQPEIADDEGQEEEREADREADEDHPDHDDQHGQAEDLVAGHIWIVSVVVRNRPVRAA